MIFKIASFNARGLKANIKRFKVFEYFLNSGCDLVFIQEAHCSKNLENTWKSNWTRNGDIVFSHSIDMGGGLMCLTKSTINFSSIDNIIPGKMQKLRMNIYGQSIIIFNIHSTNKDTDQCHFYTNLQEEIQKTSDFENLILLGDFNLVQNFKLDKLNGNISKKKSFNILSNILSENI